MNLPEFIRAFRSLLFCHWGTVYIYRLRELQLVAFRSRHSGFTDLKMHELQLKH